MPAKAAAMLTLDQINAKVRASRESVAIDVPEWGGTVLVRALSLQEINLCNKKSVNETRGGEINPDVRNGWYLVEGLVEPKLTLAEAEEWLTEAAAGPVATILAEILTRSGLTERAKDAAKSAPEAQPDTALPTQAS
jgi:hypothetical protein